jgi:uncharacterized protein (DUF362 family)
MTSDGDTKNESWVKGIAVPAEQDPYRNICTYVGQLLESSPQVVELIKNSRTFFIKPNRVDYFIDNAEVTELKLIEAVVAKIREINPQASMTLGERPMGSREDDEAEVITWPLKILCEKSGVTFLDLAPRASVTTEVVEIDGLKFSLPKVFLGSDLIVNLPKLKTHHEAGWTGAMKNFMGLLSTEEMVQCHNSEITRSIALMNKSLSSKKILTLLDMVEVQEGWGPHFGTKRFLGVLLMGLDAFAVDYVAVKLAGHEPKNFAYFNAHSKDLCKGTLEISYHGPQLAIGNPLELSPPWKFWPHGDYTIAVYVRHDTKRATYDAELRVSRADRSKREVGGQKSMVYHCSSEFRSATVQEKAGPPPEGAGLDFLEIWLLNQIGILVDNVIDHELVAELQGMDLCKLLKEKLKA